MSTSDEAVLSCAGVAKAHGGAAVLRGVSFSARRGRAAAIVGKSGAGKSTLLHILGGLERADEGEIFFGGKAAAAMSDDEVAAWRNRHLGFVYQFHHLLAELTALENVMMPLLIRGQSRAAAAPPAMEQLRALEMEAHAHKTPAQLSGGERQRAAVARALAASPSCILADEPTGNLDSENGAAVFNLLLSSAREAGAALVVVSHDEELAARMDERYILRDGALAAA